MENEIPDFNSWLELEAVKTVIALKDGTVLMVLRKYRKKDNNGKWRTGATMSFFGKEAFISWSIFISDEEIIFGALKTEEGKWEMGLPIIKGQSDENNRGTISPHIEGEKNPYMEISIVTARGRISRIIFKNDPPPR